MESNRIILAITGASGSPYARRLLQVLVEQELEVHLAVTGAASQVAAAELGVTIDPDDADSIVAGYLGQTSARVTVHPLRNVDSPISSGSFQCRGMVICPCSTGTLGRVAGGISSNVIERAADVCLKERRQLILVPRETPLSSIHLENMLRLTNAGATLLPAMPGFYHQPQSIQDLVDFVVGRILAQLNLPNALQREYQPDPSTSER
jgi:4-hydroxy-3-polyprenylbenzoate decarboxylase